MFDIKRHCSNAGVKSGISKAKKYELLKPQIIAAYKAGETCQKIATDLRTNKQAVSKWLKIWGVFDSDRVPEQKRIGYKPINGPRSQQALAMRLMANAFKSDTKLMQAFDNATGIDIVFAEIILPGTKLRLTQLKG